MVFVFYLGNCTVVRFYVCVCRSKFAIWWLYFLRCNVLKVRDCVYAKMLLYRPIDGIFFFFFYQKRTLISAILIKGAGV